MDAGGPGDGADGGAGEPVLGEDVDGGGEDGAAHPRAAAPQGRDGRVVGGGHAGILTQGDLLYVRRGRTFHRKATCVKGFRSPGRRRVEEVT
ncbi:hypothetical protein SNE510_10060 [Streptomyces sp. NE5-10]|nr:hypothetical protein SNE510_10060 [Streptomyces sp. NE5-10]